ncbi:MAG: alpha/beta hydrolase fold domain-containing protein, partial [Mycobacteriaceae bacterium]|nr:alpha/beta hydrolase fold domain-containing protein [Mycobacteriaceae bacterium]
GTLDLFHAEDITYARGLKDAGVPCQVEEVPGAFHGFDLVVQRAAVSRAFFDSQCAFLHDALV